MGIDPFVAAVSAAPLAAHVVQIGSDNSLFVSDAPSDSVQRLLNYGRELNRERPGSHLSILSFVHDAKAHAFEDGNVAFIPVRARRPVSLMNLWWALKALHRSRPIDVITTQTVHEDAWLALRFAAPRRIPVIGQIHYDLFSLPARRQLLGRGVIGRLRLWLTMRNLRRCWALRVVGRRIRDHILENRINSRVAVIPVPVTMPPANPDDNVGGCQIGEAARPVPSQPYVLFIGRLSWEKNLDDWLAVAARVSANVPAARFEIVGDGPDRARLEKLAARLGLAECVRFRGFVAYENLPGFYDKAAALLLTSHYEGFGRVLVEANLRQTPAVAVEITGVEDIVRHGETGFLHPQGDLASLAASVCRLISDRPLREKMGEAAAHRVCEAFDPAALTHEWTSLLIAAAESRQ